MTPPNSLPPVPQEFSHYVWRPGRREDIPLILEHSSANKEVDGREATQSAAGLGQIFDLLGDKAANNTLFALTPNEEAVVALAVVYVTPSDEEHCANFAGSVHVEHRGKGIGAYIMSWMEARSRQLFGEFKDDLLCKMAANCRDYHEDRIALFEHQGFQPVRYYNHMHRGLENTPHKPLPDNLEIIIWSKERDPDLMEATTLAFEEHYGSITLTPEIWAHFIVGSPNFRSEMTYLVMDGDKIAGFLITNVYEDRNVQTGVQEAEMQTIGVLQEYRGQGIASAVMSHAMQVYKSRGYTRTALDVDTENITNALRLYEKMGFEKVRTSVQFEKME